jgi:hypothetical protein
MGPRGLRVQINWPGIALDLRIVIYNCDWNLQIEFLWYRQPRVVHELKCDASPKHVSTE